MSLQQGVSLSGTRSDLLSRLQLLASLTDSDRIDFHVTRASAHRAAARITSSIQPPSCLDWLKGDARRLSGSASHSKEQASQQLRSSTQADRESGDASVKPNSLFRWRLPWAPKDQRDTSTWKRSAPHGRGSASDSPRATESRRADRNAAEDDDATLVRVREAIIAGVPMGKALALLQALPSRYRLRNDPLQVGSTSAFLTRANYFYCELTQAPALTRRSTKQRSSSGAKQAKEAKGRPQQMH